MIRLLSLLCDLVLIALIIIWIFVGMRVTHNAAEYALSIVFLFELLEYAENTVFSFMSLQSMMAAVQRCYSIVDCPQEKEKRNEEIDELFGKGTLKN